MNLRLLKIFRLVYECQSITQASKILFISQPAVSQAVLQLEEVLGEDLFLREKGVLHRSDFSHLFYEKMMVVLESFEELERFASQQQTLRISASMTVVHTNLMDIIKSYEQTHQRKLNVSVVNARTVLQRVLDHDDDLGIVEGVVSEEGLMVDEVDSLNLSFFVRKDSLIKPKNLSELLEQNLLLRDKGSSIRDAFDEALLSMGKDYLPRWESINSEAVSIAVENHLGIGLLPDVLIDTEKFEILSLEDFVLKTPVSIVYRKRNHDYAVVLDLVETIKKVYE